MQTLKQQKVATAARTSTMYMPPDERWRLGRQEREGEIERQRERARERERERGIERGGERGGARREMHDLETGTQ